MIDLNATQAAKRAGYSAKTAHTIGSENLAKPAIIAYLGALKDEALKRTKITIADVVDSIWYIAKEGEEESNRLRALDMMMKHLGGYTADTSQSNQEITLKIV